MRGWRTLAVRVGLSQERSWFTVRELVLLVVIIALGTALIQERWLMPHRLDKLRYQQLQVASRIKSQEERLSRLRYERKQLEARLNKLRGSGDPGLK